MDGMNNFKHLPFPRKIEGKPFYRRPNIPPEIQTLTGPNFRGQLFTL